MIDYKYFNFGAAPRTGTTWFMKAAAACGLKHAFKTHVHTPPTEFSRTNILNVTQIRHPCDWLMSYYTENPSGLHRSVDG